MWVLRLPRSRVLCLERVLLIRIRGLWRWFSFLWMFGVWAGGREALAVGVDVREEKDGETA